jgi:hypothetical protein
MILVIMNRFYDSIVFVILVGTLYTNSNSLYEPEIELKDAYAVSKGKALCNCTLDLIGNTIGFDLPNVKIIKNESMESQTEGTLEWTESKQLAGDGIIIGDVYIANQSAGALVDLNTMRVGQNQLLGLEIAGGTFPDIGKVEVVSSSIAINDTGLKIGDIQMGKKIFESTILFNKSINKPTLNQNSFRIQVPQQGGEAVLIVSLMYNNSTDVHSTDDNVSAVPVQPRTQNLTGIYKVILSIKG